MRSNYEEKLANRVARYNELSRKFKGESEGRYKRFHDLLSVIPMGQPILVGHHSEAGHRALLKRADNSMRASVEADKKAAYYSGKAETAQENKAISSDDVNALDRLTEKLDGLRTEQEFMKKVNAVHAKFLKKPQSLELSDLDEKTKDLVRNYVPKYSWLKHPFEPWRLTNNSANMRTIEKRIEKLKQLENSADYEYELGDVKVVENATENRIQIFFPGKPSDDIRALLKSMAFRWAPSVGAWMAYYSEHAKRNAKDIVNKNNTVSI